MGKFIFGLLLAGLILFQAQPASAVTLTWSFTGADGGSGSLDANLVSGTEYLVTSIAGNIGGNPIGALEPANTFQLNDNEIFFTAPSGPTSFGNGLEFTCPSCGGVDSFFTFEGGNFFETGLSGFSQTSTPITFSASEETSPAPLPPALPMFGAALAGLAFYGWRRKKGASA